MFSYRSLLKQAWNITWKNKYLWFLGLFASLVGGSGAWGYKILNQTIDKGLINGSYYQLSGIFALGNLLENFWLGIISLLHSNFWAVLSVLSFLLVTAIILILFIWLAISSQAGLINEVKKISKTRKNNQSLSLRSSLIVGNKHFWSVLGLNLIIKILSAAIFFFIGLPLLLLAIKNTIILVIVYVILFVILVPVAISLALMINYMIAYRVLDNYSLITSLEKGFNLFKKNWLVSLEIGIILFIISFLASSIILIILAIFLLPLFLLALAIGLNWLIFLIISLIMLIAIIFGSILTTFQIATWTNLFLRLKEKGIIAKLERLFSH